MRHFRQLSSQCLYTLVLAVCELCLGSQTLAVTAKPSTTDVVCFRDGDRISGHLRLVTRQSVYFHGFVTGEIALAWADVSKVYLPNHALPET
jgi:hypothetical protein